MIQSVASLSDKEFIKGFVKTGKELFCDKESKFVRNFISSRLWTGLLHNLEMPKGNHKN